MREGVKRFWKRWVRRAEGTWGFDGGAYILWEDSRGWRVTSSDVRS